MNTIHRRFCRSDAWRGIVHGKLLPWVLRDIALGDDVLEIGPGPGVTTERLRERAARLTAVEIDERLAMSLAERMRGTNVRVVHGDATRLAFPDGSFSGAVAFTMLHHVPSAALQDRLLAEVRRVLRPGGVFAGSDSTTSLVFRLLHVRDTNVTVPPETFAARLRAAGFADAEVHAGRGSFRFLARA
jgi:ubiquinone/menaquinone biosynthesis C-methylase UbiE